MYRTIGHKAKPVRVWRRRPWQSWVMEMGCLF